MNNSNQRSKVSGAKVVAPHATGIDAIRHCPGISPDQLLRSAVMPLTRGGLYDALQRGEIESFRLGKRIIIPTAPLLRKLGVSS
jgi:hypothetical protein